MDNIKNIQFAVKDEFLAFQHLYDEVLTSSNPLLNEALNYIKNSRGKMMRPLLVLLIAKLYGSINSSTYHSALALEILHAASLVHDDVVDESDKRRGMRSVKSVFDNKVAVLVGDFMLATSLQQSAKSQQIRIVEAVSHLGKCLSSGEIKQLSNLDSKSFSEDIYIDVITNKTAILFSVCAMVGAISVAASPEAIDSCRLFGEKLGIAFQIKDDIFDYTQSKEIGKPTSNDLREGKLTLPALYVLNHTEDTKLKEMALKIRTQCASSDEISSFSNRIVKEGGVVYAEKVMNNYVSEALTYLPQQGDDVVLQALKDYLFFVVDRTK